MKYLIEKNIIIPVEKITKEIEDKSVKYSGYTKDGENIDVYDLENGKLAPIVRYLIEGGDEKKGKLLIWLILAGLIGFLILIIVLFSGGEKEIKEKEITKIVPLGNLENRIESEQKNIEKIELDIPDNLENELRNEVDMMNGLKNEAELETLRNVYELEKKNIVIERINSKNLDLLEKNKDLEKQIAILKNNIQKQTNRIINSPKDGFIYYLGDNIYQKCENTLDDKILNNCKELYFKYVKNAENE